MLQANDILNKVNTIIKHDLKQDPYRAKLKLQCISKIISLSNDEIYESKIEQLFTYDLDQNPTNCFESLQTIELAIEIEESLNESNE